MRRGWVLSAEARQNIANEEQRRLAFPGSPLALLDRVMGGHIAREMAQPITHKEFNMDTPLERLRAAMAERYAAGPALAQDVARWTRAPRPDGAFDPDKPHHLAVDGSDLGQYQPEYVERKRKEAKAALESFDAENARVLNPLIEEALKEPSHRFQQGTPINGDARAEVSLLVEQYRGVTRQESAELGRLGMQALEHGDVQMALAHKRAADVLRVPAAELDAALVSGDPERAKAKAELDKVSRWVEAAQADTMRIHSRAGTASMVEQIEVTDYAAQNGYGEDSGSFVEAVLSGE